MTESGLSSYDMDKNLCSIQIDARVAQACAGRPRKQQFFGRLRSPGLGRDCGVERRVPTRCRRTKSVLPTFDGSCWLCRLWHDRKGDRAGLAGIIYPAAHRHPMHLVPAHVPGCVSPILCSAPRMVIAWRGPERSERR